MVNPEFQTDFNRLLSILLFYNQYSEPEDIDEIGKRALNEYFPRGVMDDNTHSNAVNVIMTHYFIIMFLIKLHF